MKTLLIIASFLLLAGCATRIPQELREPGLSRATVATARTHLVSPGVHVRWGGVIAAITNQPHMTILQIISYPLRHDGRPRRTAHSGGRFLAQVPGFLDPDVYAIGRLVTVTGVFSGFQRQAIGHFPYDFPIVRVHATFLWRPRPIPTYDPYYYGYPWPVWGGVGPFGPGFGWGAGWGWMGR
ncbi:MAG: Slp family lipoprotein [Acidiferrobacter sp.]